nr:NADH dehydrogenase [ubiquinone] 1 alpha subcomplex subunit 1 [Arachis hypogaea]
MLKRKEGKKKKKQASKKEKRREREREERSVKMNLRWMEAMLPLGIIAGMLCAMGGIQYTIHKAAHGRPKHIGNDMWDVAMERRDKKLMEQASASSN